MKENKKRGATSRRTTPQTQNHYNRIDNACLILLVIFIILVVLGRYLADKSILMLGVGIGVGATVISAITTNKEDEEDE